MLLVLTFKTSLTLSGWPLTWSHKLHHRIGSGSSCNQETSR